MGNIQKAIDDHVTTENSFVKSIQISDESDNDVIVPTGYSIRFINCQIGSVTARDSAIHFFGTNITNQLQLATCIVSIDGGIIGGSLFMATNSRINIKSIPESLSSDEKSSTAMINCSLQFKNTESFWNNVTWNDNGQKSEFINSRLEFSDCKINSQAELEVSGSEWYNISGTCSFSKKLTIKELEKLEGASDPELDTDDSNNTLVVSTNKMRGAAGCGPGCIVHFKKLSNLSFTGEGSMEVSSSEANLYDIQDVKGDKTIISYKNSSGFIASCKLDAKETCIKMEGTGNLHISGTELTSKKVTIDITGPGSNCTISKGKLTSEDNCLSIKNSFLDIHDLEKMDAKKNGIDADNSTCILIGCKEITAEKDTFDLKNGSVLEACKVETIKGETLFKGDKSSFLIRGSKLEAKNKIAEGSGVFVANP